MTKVEAMEELLEYVRGDRDMLTEDVARLERKVARLQFQITSRDEKCADLVEQLRSAREEYDAVSAMEHDRRRELEQARAALHELESQHANLRWEAKYPDHTGCASQTTVERQAEALGVANRDLATWSDRCERAENLLRGWLKHGYVKDEPEARAVPERTRAHFRALGEMA